MSEELIQKKFQILRFNDSIGIGISFYNNTYFKNYETRNKVAYVGVIFHILFWMIQLQYPIKVYGIKH